MKILYLVPAAATLFAAPLLAQTTRTTTVDTPRYEGQRIVTRDPVAGTVSKDRTLTRKADGAVATRSYDRQRTEDGFTASGSSTGFGGRTSSFDYERVRDGNGGFTAQGSATGRRGNTATLEASRTRTEGGFTRNRTIRDGQGAVIRERNTTVNRPLRRRR